MRRSHDWQFVSLLSKTSIFHFAVRLFSANVAVLQIC